jgi:TRAP-type uncharacterized transport system fused permease subunit
MFVYGPELLLIGEPLGIAQAMVTAMIGVTALAAGAVGFARRKLAWWERGIAIASALTLVYSGLMTDVIGLLGVAYIFSKTEESTLREAT